MDKDVKMLLKLILAEEEESEAGQHNPYSKKTNREMLSSSEKPVKKPETIEEFRKADLERARRDMYEPHENISVDSKEVPLWAKYALTLPEAVQYFHIGYKKLRQIVRKDKYAEYLLWNGGRVYIKRKLFEEYLDKETEL